jgi:hypothetical protein
MSLKKLSDHRIGHILRMFFIAILVISIALGSRQTVRAAAGPALVDLGAAAPFVVLTKTGITNVPTSDITGNLGTSPIASTAITGFFLVLDGTNTFSTSAQVTGKVYAANYTSPTPANLTAAIGDMQTAYTDAAGRTLPDFTELYAGNLSGRTLAPGLYKWSSSVLATSDVTLTGPSDAVWIFQVAGNLTMGSGAKMLLSGGAQSKNIFWQVGGGVGVEIGTTAHVEGTVLAAKAIHFRTGASLNGRALAQTAVTLAKNKLVIPAPNKTDLFTSAAAFDGWVLESGENSNVGGVISRVSTTLRIGDDPTNKQYRSILHFNTSSLPDTAVITKVTLKIKREGMNGTNPFTTHGGLRADIRKGFFGATADLVADDFQASASVGTAAVFDELPNAGWYTAILSTVGEALVNRAGTTQFRLHFILDDNNDASADYLSFYSGDDALTENHPQLFVQYYVP